MTPHGVNKGQTGAKTIELLKRVGIPEPETWVGVCSHQFSEGKANHHDRLGPEARFFIADESPTALDMTVQAQIPVCWWASSKKAG